MLHVVEAREKIVRALVDIFYNISEKGDSIILKEIKDATLKVRKIPNKQIRKELIEKLAEATQKIHDKMNPDKKKFPVKHQQPVRTVRKKVIANG